MNEDNKKAVGFNLLENLVQYVKDKLDAISSRIDELPAGGDVDPSGFVQAVEGMGLSHNDFTDEDKAKLDGIEFATEEDYSAMINRVFGTETGSTETPETAGEQTGV